MAAYDAEEISAYLATIDNPPNNWAKGKAFEELACYLVSGIPGISITARNETNTFGTEEIDVACKCDNDPLGLGNLADFFLVECKGWREPVTSVEVSWFLTKIRHRGVRFGILIAANGITGEAGHLERSHFLVSVELATSRIRMIIVTREEIEKLQSGEKFAELINQKVCRLHASGGRCY
jgi:hypothetical protein